jgi:hypothetical protein
MQPCEVHTLARIGLEVVELAACAHFAAVAQRLLSFDPLVAPVDESVDLNTVIDLEPVDQALAVDGPRCDVAALDRRHQGAPCQPWWRRDSEELEQARHQVDVADGSGDAVPRPRDARKRHDARHPQTRVVDGTTVEVEIVLSEALAVVRAKDDQGATGRSSDGLEQPAEVVVRVGDLHVVELVQVLEAGLGLVGEMRIEVVGEQEPARLHVAYRRPRPDDELGHDYHSVGRVDGALLAKVVPGLEADFYLCGPPVFMATVQEQLEARNVAPERIRSETF